jgi:5'-nucleotidase / UDP-sugar diphosphatase
MIEYLRETEPPVLLLDCGAVFTSHKDTAGLMLKAMALMGYDALNLGSPEFYFGNTFLEQTRSRVPFPYIASNLRSHGSRLSWAQEYLIKEVGGIKIAILGVIDPSGLEQLPDEEQVKDLEVIPPETALNKLLPDVREKADVVILLSRSDVQATTALVQAVKGIDVAISSGDDEVHYAKEPEGTVLLQTGSLGKTLGFAKIVVDGKRVRAIDRRHIPLFKTVPDDEGIARLVKQHVEQHRKTQAAEAEQREADRRKKLMEGLQLTPEEFMERFRKEQSEKERRGAT